MWVYFWGMAVGMGTTLVGLVCAYALLKKGWQDLTNNVLINHSEYYRGTIDGLKSRIHQKDEQLRILIEKIDTLRTQQELDVARYFHEKDDDNNKDD